MSQQRTTTKQKKGGAKVSLVGRAVKAGPPKVLAGMAALALVIAGLGYWQFLRAADATNQAKRGDLYKQVQKVLWDEQPYLVYFNSPQILVTRKSVQNYQNTYNGYWATRDLDKVCKSR